MLRPLVPHLYWLSPVDWYTFDVTATWRFLDLRRQANEDRPGQGDQHGAEQRRRRWQDRQRKRQARQADQVDQRDEGAAFADDADEQGVDTGADLADLPEGLAVLHASPSGELAIHGTEIPPWDR